MNTCCSMTLNGPSTGSGVKRFISRATAGLKSFVSLSPVDFHARIPKTLEEELIEFQNMLLKWLNDKSEKTTTELVDEVVKDMNLNVALRSIRKEVEKLKSMHNNHIPRDVKELLLLIHPPEITVREQDEVTERMFEISKHFMLKFLNGSVSLKTNGSMPHN